MTPICPLCQSRRSGEDRYCENDGYDFVADVPPRAPPAWEALVEIDAEYHARVAREDFQLPARSPTRRVLISDAEVAIGRHSRSRNLHPALDLSEDPGVSHEHARLVRQADGFYALEDLDSTNGTTMNGESQPIPPHTPVTITDGDRIHVGAWSTITVRVNNTAA